MTEPSVAGGRASGPFRPSRALNRFFHGRRRLGVGSLLGLPLSWMLVIYIGSLAMLVGSAMYALDPSSQKPSHNLTWHNLSMSFNLADPDVRETVLWPFLRTARMAILVTLICAAVAVPVAFFVAKVAWRWSRRAIIVSMLLPLWAGYLVKGYAWRAMVSPAGGKFAAAGRGDGGFFASTLGWTPGLGQMAILLAEVYLWLPYMILPVYAGIDRLPPSLLDAAGDLGARPFRTFRSVILPMLVPSVAAGAIFTFSLTLGDFLIPDILNEKNRYMFGSTIYGILGAPNQPLAAAYTLWPLMIIVLFLLSMRRIGAFESL